MRKVYFFDESSTNMWLRKSRVWLGPESERVSLPCKQGKSVTLMGLLGFGEVYVGQFEKTKSDTVWEFFQDLDEAGLLFGKTIVMDNLRSHQTDDVIQYLADRAVTVIWLPPAQCAYNSIELYWQAVKKKWRDILYTKDPHSVSQAWMERTLHEICYSFTREDLQRLYMGNLRDILLGLRKIQ